ncbi:MAG: SPFH domain-containing protein [Candidatus Methylomirabilis sp.]
MGGLEKLVDFLLSFIKVLRFWIILNENQHGIVWRLGRWQRLDPEKLRERWPRAPTWVLTRLARSANGYPIGPGLTLKLFAWDREFVVPSRAQTNNLRVQSITTKNGIKLQVSCVYKFEIADPLKYFMEVSETEDSFLDDLVYGALADEMLDSEWPFDFKEMKQRVLASVRNESKPFGFKIKSFRFENLIQANALRLLRE